jgi:WD repeat-containing protein 76
LLQQLELKQVVSDIGISSSKSKPKASSTKAKPVQPAKKNKRPAEAPRPSRQSARLRNVPDPDETPEMKKKREVNLPLLDVLDMI